MTYSCWTRAPVGVRVSTLVTVTYDLHKSGLPSSTVFKLVAQMSGSGALNHDTYNSLLKYEPGASALRCIRYLKYCEDQADHGVSVAHGESSGTKERLQRLTSRWATALGHRRQVQLSLVQRRVYGKRYPE